MLQTTESKKPILKRVMIGLIVVGVLAVWFRRREPNQSEARHRNALAEEQARASCAKKLEAYFESSPDIVSDADKNGLMSPHVVVVYATGVPGERGKALLKDVELGTAERLRKLKWTLERRDTRGDEEILTFADGAVGIADRKTCQMKRIVEPSLVSLVRAESQIGDDEKIGIRADNMNCLQPTRCVFPFVYNGIAYQQCTSVGHNQPWCSYDSTYAGNWMNCNNIAKNQCADLVNCPQPVKCTFPFTYGGKSYHSCTRVDHNQPWCSLDAASAGRWMDCNNVRASECRVSASSLSPIAVPDIVRKFAPVLVFRNDRHKVFPMDGQKYFDGFCRRSPPKPSISCSSGRVTINNLIYQNTFDKTKMVTYYRVGSCMGAPSIEYYWYYGAQLACLYDSISCKAHGFHDQDWEHVVVLLDAGKNRVDKVRYYQHKGYFTLDRDNFEEDSTNHPRVYVGYQAHGSYSRRNMKVTMGSVNTCQYYGDADIPSNQEKKWYTWESKFYDMRPHGSRVAQEWMKKSNRRLCPSAGIGYEVIFMGPYEHQFNLENNVCKGKDSACDWSGDELDPASPKWGCKAKTCPTQGPLGCSGGSYCCVSKSPGNPTRCERLKKDWLGVPYCPKECKSCCKRFLGACVKVCGAGSC